MATCHAVPRVSKAVAGVRTDQGDVEAEVVVNCAGQWAKQVGAMCAVTVPLHSAEHFYVVTGQIDGVNRDLPILRDPDGYTYIKEEVGGLLVGGFEPEAKPWVAPDQLPYPFEFQLLDEDWDHFAILMDSAIKRIPALAQAGIKMFYNGPESFTPDNQFILGEAPELRNFFVGAGFNSVGIASAGGAGRALAEWITEGEPSVDASARTGMLSARGTYEADITVTRLSADEFLLVSSAASTERDQDHITRRMPAGSHARLTDVTSAYAVYGVMGPKSRELLERLSRSDVSDAAFGFGSSREIDLGYATVRATRISYVGELGWELYVPAEFAVGAYQDLVRAGADLGLVNAGYYAIESMRLEKAYRAFGRELTPDDNPVEAGLLFACKLGTGIGFLGREAVEQARAAGPRRRPHRVAGPLCARTKDRSASLSRLAFALAGPGFDDSKVTSRADRNFFPG